MAPRCSLLLLLCPLLLTATTVHGHLGGSDQQPQDSREHGALGTDTLPLQRDTQHEESNQDSALVNDNGCTVSGTHATCKGDKVTEIPTDLPTNITDIRIIETNVTWIPDGVFENYPNLIWIGFRRNSLHNVSKGAFSGLPHLRELFLSGNELTDTSFQDVEYEGVSSLEMLDLRLNKLTKVPMGLLQSAFNMITIALSYNDINQLPSELKFTFPKLANLGLYQNQLPSIDAAVFNQMPNIETVNMTKNRLFVIHNGSVFMDRPLLYKLDLHENPIICDCQALWMLEGSEANKNWTVNWETSPPTCWIPFSMRGKEIPTLYHQDLTCDTPDIEAITPTNITHLHNTPLTLKANITKGLPQSKWLLPDGKWRRGQDSVDPSDHSVVTTLHISHFDMPGLVNFTVVATNVVGDSNVTFWVYTDPSTIPTTPGPASTTAPGAATGGPPVCTATLLLMLICARL